MSNFTPLVAKQYTFEGDTVEVSFARLRRGDMMKLMPQLTRQRKLKAKKETANANDAAIELTNNLIGLLPNYIRGMTGLKGADGSEIDVETMCNETYFFELATDIGFDLLDASMVMEGKKGKKT